MDDVLAVNGGERAADSLVLPMWPVHGMRERKLLDEVLVSSVWGATGMGSMIADFNRAWAEYCGTAKSVAVANGTVTLELVLRAWGIGPGDEVIVPAWTFAATAIPVSQVGATPVFADICADTLCLDPIAAAEAVTHRTTAIIPVHFGGRPAEMDPIMALARRNDLRVLEDAAQAHGATYKGIRVGAIGHAGSFSFQQSKNLQCGEGGSVTTDDTELADRIHFSLSKFGRGIGASYEPFVHHELAGNQCMTEFQAAILLAQLERLEDQIAHRERSAAALRRGLDGLQNLVPLPPVEAGRHGNHLFLLRARSLSSADLRDVIKALNAEGVPCFALYPRPLFQEAPWAAPRACVVRDCPESARACREIVAIPQSALLLVAPGLEAMMRALEKVDRLYETIR